MECACIAKQILNLVHHFHENEEFGIQIEPSKLFIDKNGTLKYFGFTTMGKYKKFMMTCRSHFTGSPYYMAPEEIQSNCLSSKADIWSVGACIFELVSGVLPYKSFGVTQAIIKIVGSEAPSLSSAFGK